MQDYEKEIEKIRSISYKKYNNFWLGTTLGLLTPLICLFGYWLNSYSFMGFFPAFPRYLMLGKVLAPVLSLCLIPNLGLFFLFLNSERYKTARGFILSTILYGFFIMYLKIFIEETMF